MTPATIIRESAAAGLILSLSESGNIKAAGDQSKVTEWLPAIREHKMAIIAALKVGAGGTAIAEPFDRESFEERAAIAEFDGVLTRDKAEQLATATMADARISCRQCANRCPHDGVCKVAEPKAGAVVIANRSYAPDPLRLWRCEGYQPKSSEPDQRTGMQRWPWLREFAE